MVTVTETVQLYGETALRKPKEMKSFGEGSVMKTPPFCPEGCHCTSTNAVKTSVLPRLLGLGAAALATYSIINSDSKLYVVFWLSFSILRRMMRSSAKVKNE